MLRAITVVLCLLASFASSASPVFTDHSVEVTLFPGSGDIVILDRVQVSARDHYRFRLAAWLEIDSLLLDGRAARAEMQGQSWYLSLPDSKPHELVFTLRGAVPLRGVSQGSVSAMRSSAGSEGVYLPGYDDWIANDVDAPATYRVTVSVPPGQLALATGKLVSEQTTDAGYRATFEAQSPGEPPSLFAGPYRIGERQSHGLRLRSYFHAELAGLSDAYLEAADTYIERYQHGIGPYPYADFSMISAPIPVGLGFPGVTYAGRQIIPLPFMRTRSLAHEVLHNWWGNGIGVDYDSGNWAEGLTTYMADYALQRDQGGAAAQSMRVKWLRDYAALPSERDQPVSAFKSKRHQASQVIGYNKVAFIFHMLNREIGQPAFDDGLRRFWSRHKYKTAGWRDLQLAFEQASGEKLDWFFRPWVQRPGAPRLSLGVHSVEQVEAGYVTRVEILQPVNGYRFTLPLVLATATGSEQHDIVISDALTRVELVTPAKPRYLQLDPESHIFRRLQRDETPPILRDVTLEPTTVTLIASTDVNFQAAASDLAVRLLDTEPRFEALAAAQRPDQSLLLIAPSDQLAEQLALLGLESPPGLPDVAHTAAAWTAARNDGASVLVVSADTAGDLEALLRPLPHYGGQSYILFDAGRAQSRGVWPITRGALFRNLDPGSGGL